MKLLLLTFVIYFAVALAAPADKQKRDILPGDPRYGTEHHHHHHEHENEVQISKAAGGYIGSFTVPDDTEDHSFQVQSQQSYGPPSHTPGNPLGTDFFASGDADKSSISILVPSTSYGIPDTQLLNNLGPVIDDKKPAINETIQEHKFDSKATIPELQQAAIARTHTHKHEESIPQVKSHGHTEIQGVIQPSLTSSLNTFPTYYSAYNNLPVKTLDHHVQVQVPHPYQIPVTKHVTVPVAVPHTVEIPKPYYFRVPQPVQVTVDRPYPVEVPRPVPYPVHHYVKTSVPVAHRHHVAVDVKDNPVQTFFDNSQLFQNVLANIPTFSNPLEGLQTQFENFEFPSLPFIPSSFPSIPSLPFFPQQPQTTEHATLSSSISSDSVAVDNPLKTETTVPKPVKHTYKPATACAGCSVSSASNKKEYVQPTDANGGYVY